MKKFAYMFILIMCLLFAQDVIAKDLSNSEMKSIIGFCKDCIGLTSDEADGKCPYSNPCKDCKHAEGETPAGCPYDSESKKYYPGTNVPKCKTNSTPSKYCHVNAGTEHSDCYRRYDCTSESVVLDKTCGESDQCDTDNSGWRCRRCKLGSPTSGLNWVSAKEDTCNSTPN